MPYPVVAHIPQNSRTDLGQVCDKPQFVVQMTDQYEADFLGNVG